MVLKYTRGLTQLVRYHSGTGYVSTVRGFVTCIRVCPSSSKQLQLHVVSGQPSIHDHHNGRKSMTILQRCKISTDGSKHEDTTSPEPAPPCPHFRTGATKESSKSDGTRSPDAIPEQLQRGQYTLPHPIWEEEELNSVEVLHRKPEGAVDKLAYFAVQVMRTGFDVVSGYNRGKPSEKKWLTRIIFLETVAGVPGMVAAMTRHLQSLRRMRRDHGWIHTLLEEAENERMHLMTALEIKEPGWLFRASVLSAQGIFVNMFFIWYLISPRFCHRFVGYLEEEAVVTYTKLLKHMDEGKLPEWSNMAAPELAVRYWKLEPDAMMRDVWLAIRADEAHHRDVNHTLGSLKPHDDNPYPPGA